MVDFLIWTEFFVSLIFNPFWAGLLFGLFLGTKIKIHRHYEYPAPERYKGKIPGL